MMLLIKTILSLIIIDDTRERKMLNNITYGYLCCGDIYV